MIDCNCDEFMFPPNLFIPAGLSSLSRQTGTFADFRRAMLRASSLRVQSAADVSNSTLWSERYLTEGDRSGLTASLGALIEWRGRNPQDFGIMLLEMWAYVCDLTSFYDSVLANEFYVGTALRRESVVELVDLLGYISRPAIGSVADIVAFASGRQPVTIPSGTQFRSGAFTSATGANPPQVFETTADATIHPLLNTFTIPPIDPQEIDEVFKWSDVAPHHDYLLCMLGSVSVKAGDLVLLVAGKSGQALIVSNATRYQGTDGQTYSKLTFAGSVNIPAGTKLQDVQIQKPAATALLWTRATDKTTPVTSDAKELSLDSVAPAFQKNQNIVLSRNSEYLVATINGVALNSATLQSSTVTITTNPPAGGSPVSTITSTGVSIPYTKLSIEVLSKNPYHWAQNTDGRQEVLVKWMDGEFRHIWQTSPNGGWSSLPSFGMPVGDLLAVASNADGRLEIFAKGTDGNLWHRWQTSPNNGWSAWESFGVPIGDLLSVASNADGRLEIFVKGIDGNLWHNWQTVPNGAWSGWASFGVPIGDLLTVASNADGRLEVFVKGIDGDLWYISQTLPSNGWGEWVSFGVPIGDLLTVGKNADGRLEVFVKGIDGDLWHVWQTAPNSGWSWWASFGVPIGDLLTVASNADGRMELFAKGIDGALWHIWQTWPSNGWSWWASFGVPIGDSLTVASDTYGRLEVFVKGIDGAFWHIGQTAPNNGWSVWNPLGTLPWSPADIRVHHSFVSAGTVTMEAQIIIGEKDEGNLLLSAPVEEPYDTQVPSRFKLEDSRGYQIEDKNGLSLELTGRLISNSYGTGQFEPDGNQWPDNLALTAPLNLFGNIVSISRGQTVTGEILGIGDGTITNQSFTLSKNPLTYLPSETFPFYTTTLTVSVDGIRWNEVPNFYGQSSDAEVFIVRQDSAGISSITFGDGTLGRLLETGSRVTANYRYGAGAAMPPAGSITQIAKAVKGLKSISSPLAPYSGEDADSATVLRTLGPHSTLLMGRAISLDDIEIAASEIPGVSLVASGWEWDNGQQQPAAHLWYIAEPGVAKATIQTTLAAMMQPDTPLIVDSATALGATFSFSIGTDPNFDSAIVSSTVQTVILNSVTGEGIISVEQIGISNPIFRSAIFETVLNVAGVTSITNLTICLTDNPQISGALLTAVQKVYPSFPSSNPVLQFPASPGDSGCTTCASASDYALAPVTGCYFDFSGTNNVIVNL